MENDYQQALFYEDEARFLEYFYQQDAEKEESILCQQY